MTIDEQFHFCTFNEFDTSEFRCLTFFDLKDNDVNIQSVT